MRFAHVAWIDFTARAEATRVRRPRCWCWRDLSADAGWLGHGGVVQGPGPRTATM